MSLSLSKYSNTVLIIRIVPLTLFPLYLLFLVPQSVSVVNLCVFETVQSLTSWEDYGDTHFYKGDRTLVIKRWLNRVEEESGLTVTRSKSGRRTLTHHDHLCLCWSTPVNYVPLISSSRKCFLQHLRQLLVWSREERDLRVWVLKGFFSQCMMTLNSGHDVSE